MRTVVSADLTVKQDRDCAVITFPVEVDACNAPEIRDRLLQVLNRGVPALVLDLSATRFCDSSGIDAILRAYIRARAAHIPFWVVLPDHGAARRVCDISGVSKMAEIAPSLTAARLRLSPGESGLPDAARARGDMPTAE